MGASVLERSRRPATGLLAPCGLWSARSLAMLGPSKDLVSASPITYWLKRRGLFGAGRDLSQERRPDTPGKGTRRER